MVTLPKTHPPLATDTASFQWIIHRLRAHVYCILYTVYFMLHPISINALVKLSLPEIPLDKELTSNCLVETYLKLRELILAVMA